MDGKSLNTKEDLKNKLREIAPQVFNEDKIDWEKLKSAFEDDINFSDERYVLNWAGKSDAFRAIQTQTTAALIPNKEESINFENTDNIFIEGENLEVLKVLQKAYYGKIKMIYIDPPYNTGNDFIYNDKFAENRNEYLQRSGEKNEEGLLTNENLYRKNTKESGHYHSNWLTMMYPRLFLARNLLRDDGVIFVSIDDNEVHNLRMVMNEIFGEENFVAQIIWKRKAGGGSDSKYIALDHEYIICYIKNSNSINTFEIPYTEKDKERFSSEDSIGKYYLKTLERPERLGLRPNLQYPIETPDGSFIEYKKENKRYTWVVNRDRFEKMKRNDEIVFRKTTKNEWRVYRKVYMSLKTPRSLLYNIALNRDATQEMNEIFNNSNIFSNPKPYRLITHIMNFTSQEKKGGIYLDFFAGSCTTAHAVLDLNKEDNGNRKFVMAQLPEKTDEKSEAYKAGYKTIADIGKERIRRVIKKIEHEQKEKLNFGENKQNLGFKVFKLQESNFKIWRGDNFKTEEELEKQLLAFVNPAKEGSIEGNMLYELLLKSGIDLNCRIEKKDSYYLINKNELVIALSKINEVIIKKIIESKPQKVITLDKLFKENDQLKTNTTLQMKDAGIEFKVV
jgi:adenine-specific DNA-methyltransferase